MQPDTDSESKRDVTSYSYRERKKRRDKNREMERKNPPQTFEKRCIREKKAKERE